MKFEEIFRNITGISCPIFGISWNPSKSEVQIAKEIIIFLEPRRVLYVPSEMKVPEHCISSVIEIRNFFTNQMMTINQKSKLYSYVSAMRLACNKFLNKCDFKHNDVIEYGGSWGHWASWYFASALGEMRGVFGIMILQIASAYGLNVEDSLASIMPNYEIKTEKESDLNGRRFFNRMHRK